MMSFSISSDVLPIFMIGYVSGISNTCPTISRCIAFLLFLVFKLLRCPEMIFDMRSMMITKHDPMMMIPLFLFLICWPLRCTIRLFCLLFYFYHTYMCTGRIHSLFISPGPNKGSQAAPCFHVVRHKMVYEAILHSPQDWM